VGDIDVNYFQHLPTSHEFNLQRGSEARAGRAGPHRASHYSVEGRLARQRVREVGAITRSDIVTNMAAGRSTLLGRNGAG